MNELVLLNSIDDAKDCISKGLYKDRYLFTTHVSVNIFLKEVYKINSTCIESIFSELEVKENTVFWGNMVDKILINLDNDLAPGLNEKYELNIRYFYPLYSYFGRFHVLAIFYFMEAFKMIIKKYSITKIFLYNYVINEQIDGLTDTHSILFFLYPELKIEIIDLDDKFIKQFLKILNSKPAFYEKFYSLFKNAYYNPKMVRDQVAKFLFKFLFKKHYDPFKKTILLHEPLYALSFLKNKLNSYNILYFPKSANIKQINLKDNRNDLSEILEMGKLVKEPVVTFFLKDIQTDLNKHIGQYISEIQTLKNKLKDDKVSLGCWGNPPVNSARALLFEYLSSEGIPVIGAQHGGAYGDCIFPWHFCSDFNRCDYFFSWGFTNNDIKRIYPDKQPRCSFVPVGRSKQLIAHNKKRIDILFPLMMTFSVLSHGLVGMPPSKLAIRQIKLLEHLNSLKDIKVTIKPFRWSNFGNCGPLVVLKRLKRLQVDSNMDLNSFLQKKLPKAILIEYPSTPLYECLHLDIEIFLMNDPTLPYEEYALKDICKRVHYAESVEEMIKKINSFVNGKLESKRDNSFFNHYVYKKDAKKNILKQIDGILGDA